MTDFLLVAWVSALIEITRFGWMFGLGKRWMPGEKLKLLFAGYNGNRNTGSDLRVQETLRQIRHVLGAQNVDFSVMTQTRNRFGREQALRRIRRRSRAHGSVDRAHVRALRQRFADHSPQRGVPSLAE